jgi:non-specific serine/threonine protein kinase
VQCPSIQLLVDRAQSVAPDFQVTPGTAGAVAELCRRLEGVPLALELAAARVAVMTPAHIVARLDQSLDLLVRQRRDVSPRHRSLRATLDWSYQLLEPSLQRFLARLCVFRGGWTLEAAEAICQEPLALDTLEQLRDCSLIVAELEGSDPTSAMPGMRYRMLEMVREYGWAQLAASGELAVVRDRHRDWYLQIAEQADAAARGPEQKAHLALLTTELDNLRAALAWCQDLADADPDSDAALFGLRLADALSWSWQHWGYIAEGLQWLEGALARGARLPAAPRASALCSAATLAQMRGHQEQSRSLMQSARRECEEALALLRAHGTRRDVADALLKLGEIARELGDVDGTWSYAEEARQRFEELEDRAGLVRTLDQMCWASMHRGDTQGSRRLMEQVIDLAREVGDLARIFHGLGGLGHQARAEGEYARARSLYSESLALRREAGDRYAMAQSVEDFGVLAGLEQQAERAIRLLGAVEAFCETVGARPPIGMILEYERAIAEGRAVLSDVEFARAWAEGRAMSLDEATEYALEGPKAPTGRV